MPEPGNVEDIIEKAWHRLPSAHRLLLETIGASQRCVASQPIGAEVDSMRISAGLPSLAQEAKTRLNEAYGAWVEELRLVVISGSHPNLLGLSDVATERFIARVAWHEWGHALSIARCSQEDMFAGRDLLSKCPIGIREDIRAGDYRPHSYTHEVVAEIYALMMERLIRGDTGRPGWLDQEIYDFLQRLTGWEE